MAVENAGPGGCVVTHPDGRVPAPNVSAVVDPRSRLRLLNISDDWTEVTLTLSSAEGATVKIWASGTPRPMVMGEWSWATRDPQSGLITKTFKVAGLVPAP